MLDIPEFDLLDAQDLKEVNEACEKFDSRWNMAAHHGKTPDFSDNLQNLLDSANAATAEFRKAVCHALLELDIAQRRKRGEPVSRSSYLLKLPQEFATVVDRFSNLSIAEEQSRDHPLPDQQISNYRIVEQIGRGGMGHVFLAEQQSPVRRFVAIKIINTNSPTREAMARFELEQQALAVMDHPNIAKVFEVGTTTARIPFFAMEWIKGSSIIDYCDLHHLKLATRLRIFQQACFGVQHAHQSGIIHRDIKPSNILVTEFENSPVAKIIDFGLAQTIDNRERSNESILTQEGQLIGTLLYMSPEQAELDRKSIDTRTDVYALGIVLYELLTGCTPLDAEVIRHQKLLDILQIIRTSAPVKPSARLGIASDLADKIATARNLSPSSLKRALQGDLDCLVLKALNPDKSLRYQSPALLAEDISRYLKGEPIEARPPSSTYRFQRFVVRNRVACSFFVVIAVAAIAWLWQEQQKMHISHLNRQLIEQSQLVSTELLSEQNRFEVLTHLDSPFEEFAPLVLSQISNREISELPDLLSQSRARRAKFWSEFGTFLGSNRNPGSLKQAISCLTFGLDDIEALRNEADTPQLRTFHRDVLESRAHFHHMTQEKEKAACDYLQVLNMLESEAESLPNDRDLQLRIATVHYKMAPDTANPTIHFQQAIEILAPQFEDHHASLNVYFRSCHDLEHITVDNAKGIELLENGMRAVELLELGPSRDLWLAWYFDALGRRLNMAGNRTRSVSERRRAIALSDQYLSVDPSSVEWSRIGTRVKYNLAISGGVDESEAIEFFRDITESYTPIIHLDSARALDTVHVMSQLNTGITLLEKRNPIEAIVYLGRARELIERSANKEYLVDTKILELLARSLVDPVLACDKLESEIDLTRAAGKGLAYFNAARIYARASAFHSVEDSQPDRRLQRMEKAIGSLLIARKSGWQKSLQDQFESDSDLHPLKSDPRIQSAFQSK